MYEIDADAGVDTVVEETYENMRYYPLKGWGKGYATLPLNPMSIACGNPLPTPES